MGERLHGMQEVRGSTPLRSTIAHSSGMTPHLEGDREVQPEALREQVRVWVVIRDQAGLQNPPARFDSSTTRKGEPTDASLSATKPGATPVIRGLHAVSPTEFHSFVRPWSDWACGKPSCLESSQPGDPGLGSSTLPRSSVWWQLDELLLGSCLLLGDALLGGWLLRGHRWSSVRCSHHVGW